MTQAQIIMARPPYVVMCMKWGTLYGPDYVNVLFRATKAHLKTPFRFVCLTDDSAGFDAGVESFPIPDMGLEAGNFAFGGWPKLSVFKSGLYGLTGRCLFIDLDSIICGDLEPMLRMDGGIRVIREWPRFADYFRKRQVNGATGVFTFELGTQEHLFDRFMQQPIEYTKMFRSEQRFVTAYSDDMKFWPADHVISFKRHLLAPPLINRFKPPKTPPAATKIVAFHGTPRPIDVVPDRNQVWGSRLRHGKGAVPFVRDYWLGFGGADPKI